MSSKVEQNPCVELTGQAFRLSIPVLKDGCPRLRQFSLDREQLSALVAGGVDALDELDRQHEADGSGKVLPLFSHKARA